MGEKYIHVVFFEHKDGIFIHGRQGAPVRRQRRMRNKVKQERSEEVRLSWRSQRNRKEIRTVMVSWKQRTARISRMGWAVLSGVSERADKMRSEVLSIWSYPMDSFQAYSTSENLGSKSV